MKKFPLEALLRTREHRERMALQVVAARRRDLAARVDEVAAIDSRIADVNREDALLTQRVAEGIALHELGAASLTTIETRRALLRDVLTVLNAHREKAELAVQQARNILSETIRDYRRALARRDSAVEQRQRWQAGEVRLADRRDESATEEHIMSRYQTLEHSP